MPQGEPDTCSDMHLTRADAHGQSQRRNNAFGQPHCIGRVVKVTEQQRELVAAEAGDKIGRPHDRTQPTRHDAQQFIARGVTQGVVDILEVVEVDEQQCLRLLRAFRLGQHGGELGVERSPIREAAQRVGVRFLGQSPLAAGDRIGHGVEARREFTELVGAADDDAMVDVPAGQPVRRVAQHTDRSKNLVRQLVGQPQCERDRQELEDDQRGHDPTRSSRDAWARSRRIAARFAEPA